MTSDPSRSAGRRALRVVLWLLLGLVVLYLLFFHLFPWVEARLNDPSLETAGRALVATSTGWWG